MGRRARGHLLLRSAALSWAIWACQGSLGRLGGSSPAQEETLLVGGNFTLRHADGTAEVANLAQWDPVSGQWYSFYEPRLFLYGASSGMILDMRENATARRRAGEAYDALVIGGAFDATCRTCQSQYCSVGAWEGRGLKTVGAGLCARSLAPSMTVKTLLINERGDLFAGGTFHSRVWDGSGFISVYNVAHFHANRQLWTPLHGGQLVCNWDVASVLALAWDEPSQTLFLGGKFNYIDAAWIPAGLAVWNQSHGLQPFPGGGLSMGNRSIDGVATALAFDADSGLLIVAGNFNRAGDVDCDAIAAWHVRDRYWTCLHDVTHSFDTVSALLFRGGSIYVAGTASWRSSWRNPQTPFTVARFVRDRPPAGQDAPAADAGRDPGGLRGRDRPRGGGGRGARRGRGVGGPAAGAGIGVGGGAGSDGGDVDGDGVWGPDLAGGGAWGPGPDLAGDGVWGPDLAGSATEGHRPSPAAGGRGAPSGPAAPAPAPAPRRGWAQAYRWEWLPGFNGTDGPIHRMLGGSGEFRGALLLAGDFTDYPSVVAYREADGYDPPSVRSVGQDGAIFGAVNAMVQMRIRPQSTARFMDRGSGGWRLAAICVVGGLLVGVGIALLLNLGAFAQLFRGLGAPSGRGTSLAAMASYYSRYGNLDECDMADAYERAMQARHLWNKSNLPVLDPTEIVLEDVIGEGSFGRVWRGSWRYSAVAVKEFVFAQAAVVGGSRQRDDLLQEIVGEAGVMAMLRHPKILHLYGCSLTMQAIWITSELCSRGSLRQVLDDEALALSDATKLRMAADAAEGMVYLHSRDPPVIHRDLKTHNLFIHEQYPGDFVVKIGDWGPARAQATTATRSMTHGVGTACWIAPEVIRSARGSKASDVYSFGIVLWEIATRRDVYPDLSATQIIAKVANESLRPPLPHACPWASLMQQCWREEAEERPTFDDVFQQLLALQGVGGDAAAAPMERGALLADIDSASYGAVGAPAPERAGWRGT